MGIFNQPKYSNIFTENILNATQKTLTSFKISNCSSNLKEEVFSKDKKIIEYVFEKGDNAIKNISK